MKEGNRQLTLIDLFAGAGGLSEGFMRADYRPIAFVEKDSNSCLTIKTRLAYYYLKSIGKFDLYVDYLKKDITREELYETIPEDILNSVINKEIGSKTVKTIFTTIDKLPGSKNVDLIIGGPPCQAYSLSGRAADNNGMRGDRRNFLYKYYGKFLEKYKPRVFLFENVPGLYTANNGKYYKNMLTYFDKLGYKVKEKVLDAADFGVLQRRRRIILIGWRKEFSFKYPDFEKINLAWTINDLFSDLPPLKAGEIQEVSYYVNGGNEYVYNYEIRNGLDFTVQHITRPHNEKDLLIYRMAIDKMEGEGKRLLNNEIPEDIRTQKNVDSFLDRFKVVRKDSISHTMIAHIAKDGHHFIHPDINQLRSLSVREAARIQSFSDDYFFEGSRTSAFTQIGNAVPPIMAFRLAALLRVTMLNEN